MRFLCLRLECTEHDIGDEICIILKVKDILNKD
ncbi:unnamed protein product [Larinioides sclopetarius]|uniref:Uncharacterized protein n=1 Tax=Larinioides sclopetarius TaxID=280406 RepID=A0AAV1ZRR3_9ARAC